MNRKEYFKEYYKSPQGIYNSLTTNLRKISKEDFIKWYKEQIQICCYCDITPDNYQKLPWRINKTTIRLSIDKIDPNKYYELGNIALCCFDCNIIKNNKSAERMRWIGQNIYKLKWKKELKL